MKTQLLFLATIFAFSHVMVLADSSIDPTNEYAYGANVGWINAYADGAYGAVIGQTFCSGYMYGSNVGWISLGDGVPANSVRYGNLSSSDFGVNHDGAGKLSGYAYGGNIGWITFEQAFGHPRVELKTGELSGYAWGANVGWIDLSSLSTLTVDSGPDTDYDDLPDAWEYGHTNSLAILTGSGDADGDGVSDVDEYGADTDPFDVDDFLAITGFHVEAAINRVTWPAKATRLYELQHATVLSTGMVWAATSSALIPPTDTDVQEEVTGIVDTNRFYRVKVEVPLSP